VSAAAHDLGPRAIVAGSLIGALLALTNTYSGLKTGWGDSGNVTASILGFSLCALAARLGARAGHPLETNIIQTIATTAGAMSTVMGLTGGVAALFLLGRPVATWAVALFGVTVASLGLVLALRVRQRVLIDRPLPFPTGQVTAELIETIHRSARRGVRSAQALAGSAGVAMLITWFRDGRPAWLPALVKLPFPRAGVDSTAMSFGISLSPMMLGSGLFVGPRTGAGVMVGSLIAWLALAPWLLGSGRVAHADFPSLQQWLMWPAVAAILSTMLIGLLLEWRALARALRSGAGQTLGPVVLAILLAIAGAATVAWAGFSVQPAAMLAALALTPVLVGVGIRATGETDVAPAGELGTLTQTIAAPLAQRDLGSTLLPGVAVCGAVLQGAVSLWALKAGALLGANVRRQAIALAIGICVGAAVSLPVYVLFARAHGIGTARFPAPGAISWKATAEGLARGTAVFPRGAAAAACVAALASCALTVLSRTRAKRLLPTAAALGVGMLLPLSYAVPIFAGGVIAGLVGLRHRQSAGELLPSVAAGAIAGEALIGVVVALLALAAR
jgi:uncharacterized oligopeptide transporter (OPT) family protein